MNYFIDKQSSFDLSDAREAERAKKEKKIPFLSYLKKRWRLNLILTRNREK